MKHASRWFFYGPFALAGVALIIWFAIWRVGAQKMSQSIDEWAATQRASGDAVSYAPLRARGFPFFLRGIVDDLAIDNGDIAYRAEHLYLDALPYAFDRLILSPGGDQHFVIGGDNWRVQAQDARASFEMNAARGWFVKAQSAGVIAQGPAGEYALDQLLLNVAPSTEDKSRLETSFIIDKFTADYGARTGAVDRAEGSFAITGYAAIQGANTPQIWAASGGHLIIRELEISIGGAKITASGSLTVDAAGFPAGSLGANITKPVGLIGFLTNIGALNHEEADAAMAALGLMAAAGNGVVNTQIEFSNGKVRIGQMPVASLSRIR